MGIVGWVKRVKIDRHECSLPELPKVEEGLKYGDGSVWRCWRCKKAYRLVVQPFSSPCWDLITEGPKNCESCGKFMRTTYSHARIGEWECWGCGTTTPKTY